MMGQLGGVHALDPALLEAEEAPPAYEDRHSDSPPLLPPTPSSLQSPAFFPTRYTPNHLCHHAAQGTYCGPVTTSHGSYCTPISSAAQYTPSTGHYTALNTVGSGSDYAVIAQGTPAPQHAPQHNPRSAPQHNPHRQYSMDLRAGSSHNLNSRPLPITTQAAMATQII